MKTVFTICALACCAAAFPQQQQQQQQQPQQQQPQQQQQQQQQPQPAQQQCTPELLRGFMITSPINFALLNNSQVLLPDGGVFVDPTNTTILLQTPAQQDGNNETVAGIKYGNTANVTVELLQNSAFAVSWTQEQAGQQNRTQPTQQGQQNQTQPVPPGNQTQAGQQGQRQQVAQAIMPQTQVLPTRVQLVDSAGSVRNVTEVLGLFGTAEALEAGEGQQQMGQQPQEGQQAGQWQKMPDKVGGVVVYIGSDVPPETYSFLVTARVAQGAQQVTQPGPQQGTQPGGSQLQNATLCRFMTHPIRVRSVQQLQSPQQPQG